MAVVIFWAENVVVVVVVAAAGNEYKLMQLKMCWFAVAVVSRSCSLGEYYVVVVV